MPVETFAAIYSEEGRLRLGQRVREALREYGQENFEAVAWTVRDHYGGKGLTPDAAKKSLERGWSKVFPGTTMPNLLKRFW